MKFTLRHLLTFLLQCFIIFAQAQTDVDHKIKQSIYLLGNTAGIEDQPQRLQYFKDWLKEDKNPHSMVFLGDYMVGDNEKEHLTSLEKKAIKTLTYGLSKKHTYFINGDRDWNNSGRDGDDKIEDFEDYVQKELGFKKAVIPSNACAGPKIVELTDGLILVAINTQWLFHPYQKPELTNTNCRTLSKLDFWDEVEDILDENRDKNILLVAHHPIYSAGRYSGKKLGYYHAIPVVGSFVHAFRRQIGTPADMAYLPYLNYQKRLLKLLEQYKSVIYASGHEFDLQVHQIGENYHLNSGSFVTGKPVGKRDDTQFSTAQNGLMRLDYYENGQVNLKVIEINKAQTKVLYQQELYASPCDENNTKIPISNDDNSCLKEQQSIDNQLINFKEGLSEPFVPGVKFTASQWKRRWLGDLWREEWLTATQLPFLDIQTKHDGLTPIGIGGGGQTYSVVLKGGNKKEYAFRLLEKDPVKKYSEKVKATVYGRVVQDMVAGQHPFGVLVVDRLLDATDILHTQSEFYMMPTNAPLGRYKAQFAGQPGVLEIRAKDGFLGSDDIKSTDKMFRKAYKSNKVRIDSKQYIKARLFDLLIGDFDRHRLNWKWAGYETEEGMVYQPLPRDRDYAFPKLEGIILGGADKITPNGGNFHDTPRRVGALTFKGRFMDRQLAPYVSWADYEAAAQYLKDNLTDEVIADAVAQLPDEIEAVSSQEMNAKLRSRRDAIDETARTFYGLLAKEVDVVGSNKREIFDIERQTNGDVQVQVFDQNKKGERTDLLFDRVFHPAETDEIRIYGLGADDIFNIKGSVDESILTRIIGGRGDDVIIDSSQVSGIKRLTKVYDTPFRDSVIVSQETKLLSPKAAAKYDPLGFTYNSLIPFPKFRISSGNGFGLELETTIKRMGFNKPQFKQQHQFQLIYYSIEALRFDMKNRFRHVINFWDIELSTRVATGYDQYPFFYGFGNDSVRDEELFEDNYYRLDFNTVRESAYLIRDFWEQSDFKIGFNYQYNKVRQLDDEELSILQLPQNQHLNGLGTQHHLGIFSELNIDFRDNPQFTKKGALFYLKNSIYRNWSRGDDLFGMIDTYVSYYHTLPVVKGLTFVARTGGIFTFGETPFYQRAAIGSSNYLRSYVRNRFVGKNAAFLNTEMRLHMGVIRNPVVPLNYGIFGFWETGRVWEKDVAWLNDFNESVGGGLYIAPFSEAYSLVFTVGKGELDDFYFSLRVGLELQ